MLRRSVATGRLLEGSFEQMAGFVGRKFRADGRVRRQKTSRKVIPWKSCWTFARLESSWNVPCEPTASLVNSSYSIMKPQYPTSQSHCTDGGIISPDI